MKTLCHAQRSRNPRQQAPPARLLPDPLLNQPLAYLDLLLKTAEFLRGSRRERIGLVEDSHVYHRSTCVSMPYLAVRIIRIVSLLSVHYTAQRGFVV